MKKTGLFLILLILLMSISCESNNHNSVNVKVSVENKIQKGVHVYIREIFPLEEKEKGLLKLTNEKGIVSFNSLPEDMYEVWIAFPGYEEMRQRIYVKKECHIEITTDLPLKSLPEGFKKVFCFGSFNHWNTDNALELKENPKNHWTAFLDTLTADSAIFNIFFDEPYQQFYNPSDSLIYLPGYQPPFRSITYKTGNRIRFTFDSNEYKQSSVPYLNHWVDRKITGLDDANSYIDLEKLLTENFQLLSKTLNTISQLTINNEYNTNQNDLGRKIDSLRSQPEIKSLLTRLYNFSEDMDGVLFDLSKIELAKIYWILGEIGNAHKASDEVDLNSFAGGEAFEISTSNLMKIPRGFSEFTRKKLLKNTNAKTRFIMLQKLALTYKLIGKNEKMVETLEMIINEYPQTDFAQTAKKMIKNFENNENNKEEKQEVN